MTRSVIRDSGLIVVGLLILLQISATTCNLPDVVEIQIVNETFTVDEIHEKTAGNGDPVQNVVITDNYMRSLPEDTFHSLPNVKTLIINRNLLTTLPENMFKNTKNLKVVDFKQNHFQTLPENIFHGQTIIEGIDLNENRITTLPAHIFQGLGTLLYLNLNKNQLTTLPEQIFSDLHKLTHLYLYGNQLSTLPENIFENQIALTELQLNGNQLKTLPANIFSTQESSCKVSLSDNPWLCDDEFVEAVHSMKKWYTDNFVCADGQTTEQKIKSKELCASECNCRFMNEGTAFEFDCSSKNFNSVPLDLEKKIQQMPQLKQIALNLDYNKMTNLLNSSMPGFERITNITAKNNSIQSIEIGNLHSNLMELDVSGNKLTVLSSSVIQQLSNMKFLKKLMLAGNVWTCDDTFFDFARFNRDIVDFESIDCDDKELLYKKHDRLAFWITNTTENVTKPKWTNSTELIRKLKHEDDLGQICPTECNCFVTHKNTTIFYDCYGISFKRLFTQFKSGCAHWPLLNDPKNRRIIF